MQIPFELSKAIRSRKKEVLKAYADFNLLELPAGYEGEVNEAYTNLKKAGIVTTPDNILTYLKAKGKLMSFFKGKPKLMQLYLTSLSKEEVAGIILPAWVIAAQILLDIVVSGIVIGKALRKLFTEKDVSEEKTVQFAEEIYNIKDVKNLVIITQKSHEKKK